MFRSIRTSIRIWWLKQLCSEARMALNETQSGNLRACYRAALNDHLAEIDRLKNANQSVQRLHE